VLELGVYAVTRAMPNLCAFPFEMYPSPPTLPGFGPLTPAHRHREVDDRVIQLLLDQPPVRLTTVSWPTISGEYLDRLLRCMPELTDLTAHPAPWSLPLEARLTCLRRLRIGGLELSVQAIEQLSQLQGLERLELADVKATRRQGPETASALQESIVSMVSLRHLDICDFMIPSFSCFPSSSPPCPVQATIRHPRLRTLKLESCTDGTALRVAAIECPRLTRCVAYGQDGLGVPDLVRACPRVQTCTLDLSGPSVDFFNHVARGWGRVRTLSLSGGVWTQRVDTHSLALPLSQLERLGLHWCGVDTAMLEAVVNAAPRLCTLVLQELSGITTLENLASESLRSIELKAVEALSGQLTLTGTAITVCRVSCVS
jgi:hypothetical protein